MRRRGARPDVELLTRPPLSVPATRADSRFLVRLGSALGDMGAARDVVGLFRDRRQGSRG